MRRLLLALAIFFCMESHAQWSVFYHDSDRVYMDAAFPTANDIYVIGYKWSGGSFLMRSTDGGLNWTQRNLAFNVLNKIYMLNATEGYMMKAGTPSILFYTTDGFNTFVTHNVDSAYAIVDLYAQSSSKGFYLNNGGYLRSFSQYGAQFQRLTDTLNNITRLSFANASTGFVGNGIILTRTTDAGLSWTASNVNAPYLGALTFTTVDTGYCSDNTTGIFRTDNGGTNFQLTSPFPALLLAADRNLVAATDMLNAVAWSSDFGQTWAYENAGTNFIEGIFINPAGSCFIFDNFTGDILRRELPLGLSKPNLESQALTVYPNPAADYLSVTQAYSASEIATIHIIDAFGREVYVGPFRSDEKIPVHNFSAGVYVVVLRTDSEKIYRHSFIKQD
ncbi:MAG: YCF48-related protein [Bacteroidia bacterium]